MFSSVQIGAQELTRRQQRRLDRLERVLPRVLEKARTRAIRQQEHGGRAEDFALFPVITYGLWYRRGSHGSPFIHGNLTTRWLEQYLAKESSSSRKWSYSPLTGYELLGFIPYIGVVVTPKEFPRA